MLLCFLFFHHKKMRSRSCTGIQNTDLTINARRGKDDFTVDQNTIKHNRMLQGNGLIPVKLIFLDIDGVMLPFPSSSSSTIFSNEALTVLEHVVATTGAEIVLSSTWRMDESAIEIIYKNFETFPSVKNKV